MSNAVALAGNVTRDPEIRYTREGQAAVTLGLAVNRRWRGHESQEWEESTSFFDIVCWRDMAENAMSSLARGSRIIVIGRLEQRSWETEEGERRVKIEVVAEEIGPSLRWATADIVKARANESRSPGGLGAQDVQGGGAFGDDNVDLDGTTSEADSTELVG
jgi:single-strand DNA-binding protein